MTPEYPRAVYTSRWWTNARVLDAIRAHAKANGSPPRMIEWLAATPGHPHWSTARQRFGSWNGALVAAGFPPRPQGRQRREATCR